jgi:hypothetical protein
MSWHLDPSFRAGEGETVFLSVRFCPGCLVSGGHQDMRHDIHLCPSEERDRIRVRFHGKDVRDSET